MNESIVKWEAADRMQYIIAPALCSHVEMWRHFRFTQPFLSPRSGYAYEWFNHFLIASMIRWGKGLILIKNRMGASLLEQSQTITRAYCPSLWKFIKTFELLHEIWISAWMITFLNILIDSRWNLFPARHKLISNNIWTGNNIFNFLCGEK